MYIKYNVVATMYNDDSTLLSR